ncbi:HNH endonuclease [Bradyrhizobium genosp. L]|uniref:HNH endonuclease signature motif containing protein n=1 Tax=Bradyrhizobium genosp. L TaxID=83637 RepID=UPI0018A3157C|nr:HNH endonuclease signature motif containing protein [Bradyrhizobium genosp. L]QPF85973.1 HNH endonuclease [Bradyrhizobium genosp. L]
MRTPISNEIAADIMFRHDRTCCVCNAPGKSVQIHHIDENPSNHDPDNLAVLCLEHHEQTQVRGGFGRKLRDVDVRRHREDWLRRIAERRAAADKIVVERMALGAPEADSPHWTRPTDEALATILNTLPIIYEDIRRRASPLLSSVVRGDMLHGLQMVIDVLAQSWIRLAAWYPPRHFGGVRADEYIAKFVADRYGWNLALWEPDGPGSGGREAAIYAHADTQHDVELAVIDTVRQLGMWLEEFDLPAWRERWERAKKTGETKG